MLEAGDHALLDRPVGGGGVVLAVGYAVEPGLAHGLGRVVGGRLVGAGVSPEDRGQLPADERVERAEVPRVGVTP